MVDLILDVGNTRTKIASCSHGVFTSLGAESGFPTERLKKLIAEQNYARIVVGSVGISGAELRDRLPNQPDLLVVTPATPTPITSRYTSMNTLGIDRIANAVAAYVECPDRPVLVIDAGTCITYDIVDAKGEFQGGAISPGLHLRARAMNAYSARLPLVEPTGDVPLVGTDTQGSLLAGVMHGTMEEIKGLIERFKGQYEDLAVFITGGDASYFTAGLKSGIFADPLLTLKGLHAILEHQN